jgi:DNA-binding GntR family transcriptional regulator
MPHKDAYVDGYIDGSAFGSGSTTPSVAEQLVRKLRVAVLRGDLRPGQKLKEIELCQEYDVSRATLREGFRILESERLFELIPNRGAFVARLGTKEIEEIHDIWAMLTGEAVYRFAERCSAQDLKELDECVRRLRRGIDAGQPLAQMEATNRFFNFVLLGTKNRMLHEMIIGLVSRLMFLRAQSLLNQGWGLLYAEEIEAIVAAMRNKSPEDARLAVKMPEKPPATRIRPSESLCRMKKRPRQSRRRAVSRSERLQHARAPSLCLIVHEFGAGGVMHLPLRDDYRALGNQALFNQAARLTKCCAIIAVAQTEDGKAPAFDRNVSSIERREKTPCHRRKFTIAISRDHNQGKVGRPKRGPKIREA